MTTYTDAESFRAAWQTAQRAAKRPKRTPRDQPPAESTTTTTTRKRCGWWSAACRRQIQTGRSSGAPLSFGSRRA